jgi:hypothetical protein
MRGNMVEVVAAGEGLAERFFIAEIAGDCVDVQRLEIGGITSGTGNHTDFHTGPE